MGKSAIFVLKSLRTASRYVYGEIGIFWPYRSPYNSYNETTEGVIVKKRALRISFDKDEPGEQDFSTQDTEEFFKRLTYVKTATKDLVYEVAKLYAGYVLLDTFRKTMIARASK